MSKIGLIGGSGLYDIKGFTLNGKKTVATPYGKPSGQYLIGNIDKTKIVFLPRPPHMINYRANIWGFKKLGVEKIISVCAVGGIKKSLKPGDIVISDQILDMTKNRNSTYYDGKDGVIHVDFTEPYCPELRRTLLKAGNKSNVTLKNGGTYIAVEGPRLETASEIKSFGILGGDVVGMTGMPEASLARELEICYSCVSIVANYAAGIKKKKLTVTEVMDTMQDSTESIKLLMKATFSLISKPGKCQCGNALKEAKI
jgi:5'-methylthioadenosine phosphorylase